jgi:ribonuclease D
MDYIHVDTEEGARELADALEGSTRVALDCEAAGFHRYSDRLCLVQITTDRGSYILDPLAVDAAAVLRGPLGDPDIEIVMHGADFDIRLLHRDLGIRMRGLFDTQVAASLLGVEAFGLASLLEARFGVKLSKKYQRADWAERPLTEGMLDYAASDTRYLFGLADQLVDEVREARRLAWVEEECAALESIPDGFETDDEPVDLVSKIKGARDLTPRQVEALRAALEWRDEIARARDRALFRVIGDAPLIEAVALDPRRVEDLVAIKGFPGGLARAEGKELLGRLRAVKELADDELRPYARPKRRGAGRPPPEVEEVVEKLKAVRNRKADELGLARGTLIPNAVLIAIALAAPSDAPGLEAVEGMRRWRVEVLGEELLRVLREG